MEYSSIKIMLLTLMVTSYSFGFFYFCGDEVGNIKNSVPYPFISFLVAIFFIL